MALNFTKRDGVILKVSNGGYRAKDQKFLDCSWIFNYFEEAERLWIAGTDWTALRIVSFLVGRSPKNYEETMRALHVFDAMISGPDVEETVQCPSRSRSLSETAR